MATFGKTDAGTTFSSFSADRGIVSTATPASSGTVTSITGRIWITTGTTPYRGFIYSDSAGAPSALLAVSDASTLSNTTEQENTLNFSGANQISVVSGTPYWIGFHAQDPGAASWRIAHDGNASGSRLSTDTYSDGSAATFTVATSPNGPIACYVTYTEGGAATPTTALLTMNGGI